MDKSLGTQVPKDGPRGIASPGPELSALRRYQRQLLYGGGGLLTLIILLVVMVSALPGINAFHTRQRQIFRDGKEAIDSFLDEREKVYANSINANDIMWATQQDSLIKTGTPIARQFLAQGEQAMILAPNKVAVPWLVLGHGAAAMPPTTLAAYLGMLQEYSAYAAATVAAVQPSGQLSIYAYDPSGTLLALTGIRDEAQLLKILKVSTREQAFAVLMKGQARANTLASSGKGMISTSDDQLIFGSSGSRVGDFRPS